MADTIYLKRGQDLDIIAEFKDEDGVAITIGSGWTATAAMKLTGSCDVITLTCVITGGNVTITQSTDDLSAGVYEVDIIASDSSGREITDIFYLNLSKTITPIA